MQAVGVNVHTATDQEVTGHAKAVQGVAKVQEAKVQEATDREATGQRGAARRHRATMRVLTNLGVDHRVTSLDVKGVVVAQTVVLNLRVLHRTPRSSNQKTSSNPKTLSLALQRKCQQSSQNSKLMYRSNLDDVQT
jgi:hypothetical protein